MKHGSWHDVAWMQRDLSGTAAQDDRLAAGISSAVGDMPDR
jgi:hypothetical protein